MAEQRAEEAQLRHVVFFQFKDSATADDVRQVEQAFAALPEKMEIIRDFEWGTNVSQEGLSDGFTHCFFITFASEADRDAYLVHPAHDDFVAIAGPHLEKACVVDYWVQR